MSPELTEKRVSRKLYAMIALGLISIVAIVTNGIFAWFYNPQDQVTINSIIEFLKNIVLTVVGYLAGASRPEEGPLRTPGVERKESETFVIEKKAGETP